MEIFLSNFFGACFFGSALSSEVFMILMTLLGLFVLYVYYIGVKGIIKWISFKDVRTRRELHFEKQRWDAIEDNGNKRLKRFGIHAGWVGAEYEHDNRD